MKKLHCISCLFLCLLSCQNRIEDVPLQNYVDTRVGTAASITRTAGVFGKNSEEYGQTLPAVLAPHGMNFWTPQTQDTEQKCIAPYYYRDSLLQGFRNSHWIVGGCTQDYGSMTVMPLWGELKCQPAARASLFSHDREIATPSYYSTFLDSYGIQAEMTATSRAAIFQFTYTQGGDAYLVVNPNSDEGEGAIEVDIDKKEIRGYNPVHRIYQGWGEPGGFKGHFVVRFEKMPEGFGVYQDSLTFDAKNSIGNKRNIGAYIHFKVKPYEVIKVKVASSFSSMEGALMNLSAEIPDWDFLEVRKNLADTWEKELGHIRVEGDLLDKQKLYGALYRASFLPRVYNDVDGTYPAFASSGKCMKVEGRDYYDDFSMWDTYRALHPLQTIMNQNRSGQMVQSLIDKYEQGGWLPIFPCWNSYTAAMIGDHCTSVIGDAYLKGVGGFDVAKAYEAMRKNAFVTPEVYKDYENGMGRRALTSYLEYGYIPLEDSVKEAFHTCEQVSRTLEYAYDDFVLSQVALKLGKMDDYNQLMQRAANYKNVIDPRSGYALGRYGDGRFLEKKEPFSFVHYITEGAPCHYTWYVPHDVKGLAEHLGGNDLFIAKLDSMFTERRYWHGNEPCHQIAYLYNYVGQPWKTQERVREILSTEYLQAPGGLSGNDDAGQMSAWYVFSALGFYPVCPGMPYYVLGSPTFEKATLMLEGGKNFQVIANGVSAVNKYIQWAKLNGEVYDKSYLSHADIIKGGVLEFQMGAAPNKEWAAKPESSPPSMVMIEQ